MRSKECVFTQQKQTSIRVHVTTSLSQTIMKFTRRLTHDEKNMDLGKAGKQIYSLSADPLVSISVAKIYRHSQITRSSTRGAGLGTQRGCTRAWGREKTHEHYLQKRESVQKRVLRRQGKIVLRPRWSLCALETQSALRDLVVVFFYLVKCTWKKIQPL